MFVDIVLEAEVDPVWFSRAPLTEEVRQQVGELIGAQTVREHTQQAADPLFDLLVW